MSSRVQPVMPSSSSSVASISRTSASRRGRFAAGGGRADDLGADLPELPVAALLRALAAELRADVVELLQLAGLAQLVLDVGADHAGGVFGAQGQGLGLFRLRAGAVLPGVHLLGDDVGFLAHAAGKKGRVFKDGRANLAEVVAGKDLRARWLRCGSTAPSPAAADRASRARLSGWP